MGLCDHCVQGVISKLTPNDIYALHELQEHNKPQAGISKKELQIRLQEQMSVFQLGQVMLRLELLGMISIFRSGKIFYYSITESGLRALAILKNE